MAISLDLSVYKKVWMDFVIDDVFEKNQHHVYFH